MPLESHPPAKLCPRCGAFYQDLKSQTCPQCFARLEVLEEDAASQLSEEQAARVRDARDLEAKAVEDERYKEQSFGACLAVIAVLLATFLIAVLFIRVGALLHHAHPPPATRPEARSTPVSPDTLLPPILAGLPRRELRTAALLPGTSIPLYEGIYRQGVQVYALPNERPTTEQEDTLRLAASLAAGQHDPPLIVQEISTDKAQYAILGESKAIVAQVADSLVRSRLQ